MPRQSNYSREFKEAIVSKIVNRGNQTVAQVCEAEGIGKSTATNWLRNATMSAMNKKTQSKKWSAKEKLRAVGETLSASETEIGSFLRREGLHGQQLQERQNQALSSLESGTKSSASHEAFEALVKQNRELKRAFTEY